MQNHPKTISDTLPLDFDPPTPRGKGGRPRLGIEPLTATQRQKRYRDRLKAGFVVSDITGQTVPHLLAALASGLRALRDAPDSNETRDARAVVARIMRELAQRHGIEF